MAIPTTPREKKVGSSVEEVVESIQLSFPLGEHTMFKNVLLIGFVEHAEDGSSSDVPDLLVVDASDGSIIRNLLSDQRNYDSAFLICPDGENLPLYAPNTVGGIQGVINDALEEMNRLEDASRA
jgi:hypothetical protein